jgi:hypothetical protein
MTEHVAVHYLTPAADHLDDLDRGRSRTPQNPSDKASQFAAKSQSFKFVALHYPMISLLFKLGVDVVYVQAIYRLPHKVHACCLQPGT